MKIIGITGTNASGKDSVAEYLTKNKGFESYSLSDEIRIEASKRELPHTRENLGGLANEIREKFGFGELAKRAMKRASEGSAQNVLFTSIRNIEEIKTLKEVFENFKLIFVDAPVEIRYKRSLGRGRASDGLCLDDFKKEDARIMNECAGGQQLALCKEKADHEIINDGSLEELQNKAKQILSQI